MQLPRIVFGGEEFIDISSIVSADFKPRSATIGLSLNHSVGQTHFADLNANGTTEDEEIQHIKNVHAYHVKVGYGGLGYNAMTFHSGRVYVVGRCMGQRAHVAHRNHELAGICMAGDYSTAKPSLGVIYGAAKWVKAMRSITTVQLPLKGHGQWAVPTWPTSCPGAGGLSVLPAIDQLAREIEDGNKAELERKAREAIAAALTPNAQKGDVGALAAQIAWITGGKVCGR